MSNWCDNCGQFMFSVTDGKCSCKVFQYRIPEYHGNTDDDWKSMYVRGNHESVATLAAEEYYNEDPFDPNDFDIVVEVKDFAGEIKRFKVTASVSINFDATEKGEDEDGDTCSA